MSYALFYSLHQRTYYRISQYHKHNVRYIICKFNLNSNLIQLHKQNYTLYDNTLYDNIQYIIRRLN